MRNGMWFCWCFVAHHLVLALPLDWRLSWALLPFAGQYAYARDYAEFCSFCDYVRAGRHAPSLEGSDHG